VVGVCERTSLMLGAAEGTEGAKVVGSASVDGASLVLKVIGADEGSEM
jgi:hypothetical protein